MVCDNSVWAGPDGLRFKPMYNHSSIHHPDDTKDTAIYNASSGRYVIYVRRGERAVLDPPGRDICLDLRWPR